jgi:hypothetical protein
MIVILKYATLAEANYKLKGGLIGGKATSSPFEGLVGRTLTFSNPSGTCTFTQPSGKPLGQLRFADVKQQLEAAIADLVVSTVNDMIAFHAASTGMPVSLSAADEPARTVLGFANNADLSGYYLNPPNGIVPRLIETVTEQGAIYISAEIGAGDVQLFATSLDGSLATASDGTTHAASI